MKSIYATITLQITAGVPTKLSGVASAYTVISASVDPNAVLISTDGASFNQFPFSLVISSEEPFNLYVDSTVSQTVVIASTNNAAGLTKTQGSININGSVTVTGDAVGIAPTNNPIGVAGVDGGGLTRRLVTSGGGLLRTVAQGLDNIGAAITAAPIVGAGTDSGNLVRAQQVSTDRAQVITRENGANQYFFIQNCGPTPDGDWFFVCRNPTKTVVIKRLTVFRKTYGVAVASANAQGIFACTGAPGAGSVLGINKSRSNAVASALTNALYDVATGTLTATDLAYLFYMDAVATLPLATVDGGLLFDLTRGGACEGLVIAPNVYWGWRNLGYGAAQSVSLRVDWEER